jgi:hypothetical protein
MKIDNLVEDLFSHAVALDQSGGLRNTIYALGKEIFILNYDYTVLLRFLLRKSEAPFHDHISFRANDYDSREFEERDGMIVFTSQNDRYTRRKSCGTPDLPPEDVKALYRRYAAVEEDKSFEVEIHKDVLSLLDRDLSHIEFRGKKGDPIKLVQRNIYSGAIIEIEERLAGLFKACLAPRNFGPLALRTPDFAALFAFQDLLRFNFPLDNRHGDFIRVDSIDKNKRDMTGFIACCLYDEIIEILASDIRKTKQIVVDEILKRRK